MVQVFACIPRWLLLQGSQGNLTGTLLRVGCIYNGSQFACHHISCRLRTSQASCHLRTKASSLGRSKTTVLLSSFSMHLIPACSSIACMQTSQKGSRPAC